MKHLKSILAVLLCMLFAVGMTACGSKTKTTQELLKENPVVAEVNGEGIHFQELYDVLESNASQYGMTTEQFEGYLSEEEVNNFRDDALTQLIYKVVMKLKAQELGFYDFTEEEEKKFEESAASFLEDFRSQIAEYIDQQISSGAMDESKRDEAIEKEYKASVEQYGYTEEFVRNYYRDNEAINRLYESITGEISVTDKDIEDYYKEELAAQKKTAQEDPDKAKSNYANSANSINLFIPEGFRYVKHILIAIPDDVQTEISTLASEGKTEESEKKQKEELEKIRPAAEEVLSKVKAGEDFDALIEQYGEDPGMQQDPAKTEGYLTYEGASFVDEFKQAAMALAKVGDTTELVESSFGFHIIKYVSEVKSREVPFAEVKEELSELLLADGQQQAWMEAVDSWVDAAAIKRNVENYMVAVPAATATPEQSAEPEKTQNP